MKFTVKGITFLGLKRGVSQKTQKEYTIVSLLTLDNDVIHCFTDKKINLDLKKFDRVEVEFYLNIGRNNKLTVIDIRKIAWGVYYGIVWFWIASVGVVRTSKSLANKYI